MKKIYLFIIIIAILIIITPIISLNSENETNVNQNIFRKTNLFTEDELLYIERNNFNYDQIFPYLEYNKFNIYKFYDYENIRNKTMSSYLEALNVVNNPNYYGEFTQNALFINTLEVLVNKNYFLNPDYIPNNLTEVNSFNVSFIKRENEIMLADKEMMNQYELLYNDALKNGIKLIIFSAYRSFEKQNTLYKNSLNNYYVAKPGHSEHQTGLALDISSLENGLSEYFDDSKEFNYLINNCYKYGFILRYPKDKIQFTKYYYEPWHFRYVGIQHSMNIKETNCTFEEYLFKNFEI